MGIAIDGTTVYVCASRDPGGDSGEPWRVQLLRSTLADDGSLAPFEVVPIGEAMGGPRHQGCAVEVADGFLWVSIGEANRPAGENRAQDPDSLNGKILRLALDGSIPDDNPFGSAVYSLGHRNPQGIAVSPSGLVVAAEHGTDVNDEVNVIVAGGNYGYPCFTGASRSRADSRRLRAGVRLPPAGLGVRLADARDVRRDVPRRLELGRLGGRSDREHAEGGGPPSLHRVGDGGS